MRFALSRIVSRTSSLIEKARSQKRTSGGTKHGNLRKGAEEQNRKEQKRQQTVQSETLSPNDVRTNNFAPDRYPKGTPVVKRLSRPRNLVNFMAGWPGQRGP